MDADTLRRRAQTLLQWLAEYWMIDGVDDLTAMVQIERALTAGRDEAIEECASTVLAQHFQSDFSLGHIDGAEKMAAKLRALTPPTANTCEPLAGNSERRNKLDGDGDGATCYGCDPNSGPECAAMTGEYCDCACHTEKP